MTNREAPEASKLKAEKYLRALILPIVIAAAASLLYGIWVALDLPPEQRVIEIAREYFARYGLTILVISSFFEGLLVIGWYFPGSIIFFLGLITAGKDLPQAGSVTVYAIAGLWLGYVVNFYLGKYGWYRLLAVFGAESSLRDARTRLEKHGLNAIALTYWHPNIGSVVSTAAGILRFSDFTFLVLSLAGVAFWLSFWSVIVYFLGASAISILGFRVLIVLLAGWMIIRFLRARSSNG